VGRSIFDYLVEVGSEDEVKNLKPDFVLLREIPIRGVMVTSRASSRDLISSPLLCPSRRYRGGPGHRLGPLLPRALLAQARKTRAPRYQVSERGGTLRSGLRGDRVYIGGRRSRSFAASS